MNALASCDQRHLLDAPRVATVFEALLQDLDIVTIPKLPVSIKRGFVAAGRDKKKACRPLLG